MPVAAAAGADAPSGEQACVATVQFQGCSTITPEAIRAAAAAAAPGLGWCAHSAPIICSMLPLTHLDHL